MVTGAVIIGVGIVLGWAMSNTQHKKQEVIIVIHDETENKKAEVK